MNFKVGDTVFLVNSSWKHAGIDPRWFEIEVRILELESRHEYADRGDAWVEPVPPHVRPDVYGTAPFNWPLSSMRPASPTEEEVEAAIRSIMNSHHDPEEGR